MGVVGRRSTGGVSMEKLLIWMTMNWVATLKKDVVLVMLVICTVLLMTVEHTLGGNTQKWCNFKTDVHVHVCANGL